MADYHESAVRFGLPGKLWVAPLGSAEPTTASSTWAAGWVALGLTEAGSTINYTLETASVSVAEDLDVIGYATTGRTSNVTCALAELTYRNLGIMFNNGVPSGAGVGDASAWTFEPPDLGSEKRIMLGWDSNPTQASNDLRFIFRQVLQSGQMGIQNQKGANIAGLSATFSLEKPTGKAPLKIWGGSSSNPV